jgi:chromosome segregation ATPase
VSDTPFSSAPLPPEGPGMKIPILFGAVLALVGASVYFYYQLNQIRTELADTRDQILAEVAKVNETSSVTTATNKQRMDALRGELATARSQASRLAGDAKVEAEKHADDIAAKLSQVQDEQAKKVTEVSSAVTQVKEDATQTKTQVGAVTSEVGTLKTDQASTRSELEKTISDLKSTKGDLGVQSGLIATNGKELSALKALGERNYVEFKLAKEKTPQKIGDVQIKLTKADPKKNRYTIELIADDKMVEKKDKTINEPVQFLLSRAVQPYELVVNEVRKDMIVGYVAAPKVQQARK